MSGTDWLTEGGGAVARLKARFRDFAFSPHRHDTYTIALTTEGVQSFTYRGESLRALPGEVLVLHPDEIHDGRAGDERPFAYRAAYIASADLQAVLERGSLPFVREAVSADAKIKEAARILLGDFERPLDEAAYAAGLLQLALAMARLSGAPVRSRRPDRHAVLIARDFIDQRLEEPLKLSELERVCGHSRWQLSRDFRLVLGVSPYRYWLCRRVERAQALLLGEEGIAGIAAGLGFTDQSHMTRQFREVTGMTPMTWRKLASARSF